MKRVISLLLGAALVLGMAACAPSKNKNDRPAGPIAFKVGALTPGTNEFAIAKSDLYDYFVPFLGFGLITKSDRNLGFDEDELIAFAMTQLSYEGADTREKGVTQKEINVVTKRFFNQEVRDFDSEYLAKDETGTRYIENNIPFAIGQFMVLRSMTVEKDGLCRAVFDRSTIPGDAFVDKTEEEIKSALLSGDYTLMQALETVEVEFYEASDEKRGYHYRIISIRNARDD